MLIKISPKRYTLRKEYFGGILHDAKTTNIELVTRKEYKLLKSIIDKYQFTSNNIRVIDTKKIRKGILTAPIRIFDSYTRRCNFMCKHCYFSSSALIKEKRRTISETKKIIKKFYNAGTMEWRFTGGEALIYPDIFEAITTAKNYGMNVGIYTNGCWSDLIAKKIFDSGIDEIAISLEGSSKVNDKRRRKGGYDKVINTFERICKFNENNPDKIIKVIITSSIGKDNIKDIHFLSHLAANYKFDINFIPLKPSGRARYTLTEEMLDPKEYMFFAQSLQKLRENNKIKISGIKISFKYKDLFCQSYEDKSSKPFPFNYSECGALTTYLSIMPDGHAFSCPFILDVDHEGKYMGPNIINTSVEEAWNHPNFERYRKATKIGCGKCKYYMKQCRGKCRATVLGFGGEIKNGKLIGDDPQCFASLI